MWTSGHNSSTIPPRSTPAPLRIRRRADQSAPRGRQHALRRRFCPLPQDQTNVISLALARGRLARSCPLIVINPGAFPCSSSSLGPGVNGRSSSPQQSSGGDPRCSSSAQRRSRRLRHRDLRGSVPGAEYVKNDFQPANGFTTGGFSLNNNYDPTYALWSGFSVSSMVDNTFGGND